MKKIKLMSKIKKQAKPRVPLSVPVLAKDDYIQNYLLATKNSEKLFLFAGDQKIEHMNKDFYGKEISKDDADPEHLFKIASKSNVGAFATQLGLISKYADDYRDINYVVKLNSKTDLASSNDLDPMSFTLNSVDDVVELQNNSGLSVVGVGYTVYLGSEYEAEMLSQAAQIVFHAHKYGLLAILWMYPRGKAVKNEKTVDVIAGAAGVGLCLGADFVKVNPPEAENSLQSAQLLKQVTAAAGRTKVICSGGQMKNEKEFLQEVYEQIAIGGSAGCAIGRNIHQKNLDDAVKFCNTVAAVVIDGLSFEKACEMLK